MLSHGLIRVNQISLPVLIDLGLFNSGVTVWVIESLMFQYSFDCGPNQIKKKMKLTHMPHWFIQNNGTKAFFIWQFWHLSFVIQNLILDVCSSRVYHDVNEFIHDALSKSLCSLCRSKCNNLNLFQMLVARCPQLLIQACQASYLYRDLMSPVPPLSSVTLTCSIWPSFEQLAIEFNDSNMHCVEDQSIKRTKPWRVLCCH